MFNQNHTIMWRAKIHNRAFDRMGERYSHLIDPDHFLGRTAFDFPWKSENIPPANMKKKEGAFELEIAVPGYSKDEIEITVEGDLLKIKGQKNKEGEIAEKEEYILEEFDYESFERCFRLAPEIAKDEVKAVCKNGILRLTFREVPVEAHKTHTKVPVL